MRSMGASSVSGSSCLGFVMTNGNPWAVPEPAPEGGKDPNDLFAAVGRALPCWETLEVFLANLFFPDA